VSTRTVSLDYFEGNVWPSTYTVDWSTVTDIQDVAQVVDGQWTVNGDTVATGETGYDRLIAIGDRTSYRDYEITAPVTILALDPDNPDSTYAVGFLVRWQGHSVRDDSQPAWGYFPLGALGLYRWDGNHGRLWMAGNNYTEIVEDASGKTLQLGVPYVFKARVQTTPEIGGSTYSLKVWREGDPEPANWDLTLQTGEEDLSAGSVLLLAHYVDAAFGTVTITPLGNTAPTVVAPIADVTVRENAPDTVVDLFEAINDTQDPDSALDWKVQSIDNAALFASTVIDVDAGTLTLDFAPDVSGTANVTIRATDSGGLFVEDQFQVTVLPDSPGGGLVGHWKFDDDNGDNIADDASGNGNHGAIHGPSFADGQDGSALVFDGVDDYVDLGSLDVHGTGLTITAWINADSFDGYYHDDRIVSKATGTQSQDHYWMLSTIRQGSETRLRFRLKTDGNTDTLIAHSGNLLTGQWHHVAAVYDGSWMRLYLDGSEVGRLEKTGAVDMNAAVPVWIGRNPSNDKPFHGSIDDVRIYDHNHTEQEIRDLIGDPTVPTPVHRSDFPWRRDSDQDTDGPPVYRVRSSENPDRFDVAIMDADAGTPTSSNVATSSETTILANRVIDLGDGAEEQRVDDPSGTDDALAIRTGRAPMVYNSATITAATTTSLRRRVSATDAALVDRIMTEGRLRDTLADVWNDGGRFRV
jgi:hypothetical protein